MPPFERGLLTALAVFRWATWAWLVVVLVVTRDDLAHRGAAAGLAALALAVSAAATYLLRARPERLRSPVAVGAELAVGAALLAADGWVYRSEHSQSLGSAWPLAGVLSAGAILGPEAGGGAGVLLGLARAAGGHRSALSLVSSGVLFALAGAVAGFGAQRLRRAEAEISAARAREEVARTLHDGVLQTLAIVQRRATDPDLARLAREQERDLRAYLFGAAGAGAGELAPALLAAAARFEDRYGARAEVVVAEDVPSLRPPVVAALAGAVGEALTNAAKHGGAHRVTVYAEPADEGGVFCSVKDDGTGFDTASTTEGVGLARSVRSRVEEVGGRVEVDGNAGRGTEVRLWVP